MKDLWQWSSPYTQNLEDVWKIASQAAVFNINILGICVKDIRMTKVCTFLPKIWVSYSYHVKNNSFGIWIWSLAS